MRLRARHRGNDREEKKDIYMLIRSWFSKLFWMLYNQNVVDLYIQMQTSELYTKKWPAPAAVVLMRCNPDDYSIHANWTWILFYSWVHVITRPVTVCIINARSDSSIEWITRIPLMLCMQIMNQSINTKCMNKWMGNCELLRITRMTAFKLLARKQKHTHAAHCLNENHGTSAKIHSRCSPGWRTGVRVGLFQQSNS